MNIELLREIHEMFIDDCRRIHVGIAREIAPVLKFAEKEAELLQTLYDNLDPEDQYSDSTKSQYRELKNRIRNYLGSDEIVPK